MLVAAAGCSDVVTTVQPAPIPVALSGAGGALVASGTVDGVGTPFSVVLDTGSPLTVYDDHDPITRARTGNFRLFGASGMVPRVQINGIQMFVTPLHGVGEGAAPFAVGGVLGGDNLQRWAVGLDYRGSPTIQLTSQVVPCSCELAVECQAMFPFSLAGGQQTIALGTNLYTYGATRVLLDACLEPLPDPVSADLVCAGDDPCNLPPTNTFYQPHGVDVKLIVATGFPGLAIGGGAFDRLRGPGSAAALLASSSTVALHLPDLADDGPSSTGLGAGKVTLGGPTRSALALVSRELYLGPCAELARSRRQRRSPPGTAREPGCLERVSNGACKTAPQACVNLANPPGACDDNLDVAHTAAVIELTAPLPAYVVDDAAPLLQAVNADLRPGVATVEGVLGTEVLERLVSTIDYPKGRFIARCVSDADCLTYPRFVVPTQQSDCENSTVCVSPSNLQNLTPSATSQLGPGGRCLAAPPR